MSKGLEATLVHSSSLGERGNITCRRINHNCAGGPNLSPGHVRTFGGEVRERKGLCFVGGREERVERRAGVLRQMKAIAVRLLQRDTACDECAPQRT